MYSELNKIYFRAPQRIIISSFIYLIHLNDISIVVDTNFAKHVQYADDTALIVSAYCSNKLLQLAHLFIPFFHIFCIKYALLKQL